MGQVSVRVNGRDYAVTCDDGEEDRLAELAGFVDRQVAELVESVGQLGEARLILMAALLIADELDSAYAALADSGKAGPDARALEGLAARVEHIAATLESA